MRHGPPKLKVIQAADESLAKFQAEVYSSVFSNVGLKFLDFRQFFLRGIGKVASSRNESGEFFNFLLAWKESGAFRKK